MAMRAWRSSGLGLDALELTQTTIPPFSAAEALVRVETAALNFSDLLMIDDRYQVRPPRPFIPGQEISGTVVAAGAQSGLAVGQRVASKLLWGGFAEYAPVRGDMAIHIPDGMTSEAAGALPVSYTTAMVALTESTTIKHDETVLVLAAAGGIGLAAVEIARHLGARVIAAAGGEAKCFLARQHGAHAARFFGGQARFITALANLPLACGSSRSRLRSRRPITPPSSGGGCAAAIRSQPGAGRRRIRRSPSVLAPPRCRA